MEKQAAQTTVFARDFSTGNRGISPQPVGNSVDISAIKWNFPRKIRGFGDFCRVKSNLGAVE
jgi:hypothetical protein